MYKKLKHYSGRLIDICVMPLTPPAYRLALQYKRYAVMSGFEPEVRKIAQYARRGTTAIDVGANMGLWTYAMAQTGMFDKILAFEPNLTLTNDLISARLNNVSVLHQAISNESGKKVLRIPQIGKLALSGWASLEAQIDLDTDKFHEILVETVRLDDLDLNGVGFIKIDVEGHELNLLAGAYSFFTRERPVCIIECRERNKSLVEEFFSNLGVGYRLIDTKAQYGFDLSNGNLLFSAEVPTDFVQCV